MMELIQFLKNPFWIDSPKIWVYTILLYIMKNSYLIHNMLSDMHLSTYLTYLACDTEVCNNGFAFYFLENWSYQSWLAVQWNLAFVKWLLKQKLRGFANWFAHNWSVIDHWWLMIDDWSVPAALSSFSIFSDSKTTAGVTACIVLSGSIMPTSLVKSGLLKSSSTLKQIWTKLK